MAEAALFVRPAGESWVVVSEGRPSYPHYSYAAAFAAAIGKAASIGADRVLILDRDGRRQVEHKVPLAEIAARRGIVSAGMSL